MPSYDYKCDKCNTVFEFQHSMEDTMDWEECPNVEKAVDACYGGYLHKVFTPTAVSFKGSGWGKVYGTYKPKDV